MLSAVAVAASCYHNMLHAGGCVLQVAAGPAADAATATAADAAGADCCCVNLMTRAAAATILIKTARTLRKQ